MKLRLKKPLVALLVSALLSTSVVPAHAAIDIEDSLPDMGTTAGSTLSINQEIAMGDYYTRQLRNSAPLVFDPLLSNYINNLGQKLVSNANSVKTPFHFYLVNNPNINAFAYFGGNIVLHSALFRYSRNESELASVMAHEITHVTQRHLARMLEDQKKTSPLALAGVLGSILIFMANPNAGLATFTGSMAGMQQNMITFTQMNEQEADRIGIQILYRAGFDPKGMPDFMQILADQVRYSSKPPEMLLTHPLPDSRLSDARSRASQYPARQLPQSADFLFAKMRVLAMLNKNPASDNAFQTTLDQFKQGTAIEKSASNYAQILIYSRDRKFDEARKLLTPMLEKEPNNIWLIDAITDIDLEQNRARDAVARLQLALKQKPNNNVIIANLANSYMHNKQYNEANRLLYRYTFDNPSDPIGWQLMAENAAKQGDRAHELAAYAEDLALRGDFETAIRYLGDASRQVKLGSNDQARFDARIDQLRKIQQRDSQFK
ncbi:M48 family metalloprotease [Proteus vulgaris]